jgi:hypothetical protein
MSNNHKLFTELYKQAFTVFLVDQLGSNELPDHLPCPDHEPIGKQRFRH